MENSFADLEELMAFLQDEFGKCRGRQNKCGSTHEAAVIMKTRPLSFVFAIGLTLALIAGLTLTPAPIARADTVFTVDTTADTTDANPGDGTCADSGGDCSLRAAIGEANALPGADTIILPPGTYTLSLVGSGEDANATGDLDVITGTLTIDGGGAANTLIDGTQLDCVLHVQAGTSVTLNDLQLTNGRAPDGADGADGAFVGHSMVGVRGSSRQVAP